MKSLYRRIFPILVITSLFFIITPVFSQTCTATEWQCADGVQCIPESYYCDGSNENGNASWGPDCADGSDEKMAECCGLAVPTANYDDFTCGTTLGCTDPCYVYDESTGPVTENQCTDNCQCTGARFCNAWGNCEGDAGVCGGASNCGTYFNNQECNNGGCWWVINANYPNGACLTESEANVSGCAQYTL